MSLANLRDRVLIAALASAALIAIFWFILFGPLRAQRAELSATLAQRQQRVEQFRRLAAERQSLERDYRILQDRIRVIEAKLPPAREIPALLRRMQAVATESQVKLVLLRPGPLTGAPAAANGQKPAEPAGGKPPQPAARPLPYDRFRLDLGFEGTYEHLLTFTRRLENFPRFIAMTQLTLSAQEVPRLRLSLVANTFVLPESGSP